MDMVTLWNWIGVTGMFIGVVVFGLNTRRSEDEYSHQSAVGLFFVPLIALALYLIMVVGDSPVINFGRTEIEGRPVYWIRYVTWFLTTPLLLNQIARLVQAGPALKTSLWFADMFMIATGGVAELSRRPANYIWYTVSSIAFVFILVLLYTDLTALARDKPAEVQSLFRILRDVNAIVWIGYPVVWILGTAGLQMFGVGVQTMLYTILDLIAKVGFGLIIVSRRSAVEQSARLAPAEMRA